MSEKPQFKEKDFFLAGPNPDEVRSMPKSSILKALSTGEIEPRQLIWNEEEQSWSEIREVPHLLAADQNFVETPFQDIQKENPTPIKINGVAPSPKSGSAAKAPTAVRKPAQKRVVHEKRSFTCLHGVALISFLVLASIIGANYYLVEQPFQEALATNGLAQGIYAYANLGGFYQSDVIIIHVFPSDGLTKNNFLKTLVLLAKSTPPAPEKAQEFKAVCLTPAWNATFILSGDIWRKLAQSNPTSDDQKIALLVDNLQDAQGNAILSADGHGRDCNNNNFLLDDRERNAWIKVSSVFVKESGKSS